MKRIGPIPQLGYGTWQRRGDVCYRGVTDALEIGYRHIDTAESYDNEAFVGKAIAASAVARSALWVTTKVAPENFGPGQIRPHVEASLDRLRLAQVDLLLLHYPSINDEYQIEDYLAQLAAVHDAGLTRHIGVSNFTKRHIDRALALWRDRPILTNQVEIHPFLRNRPIVEHCRSKGISLTSYAPLARGAVAEDEVLAAIAEARGVTPAQVALGFLMLEGFVVIPSAGSRVRIAENFAAQEVALSADEMDQIRALDRGMRLVDGPWCPNWDV